MKVEGGYWARGRVFGQTALQERLESADESVNKIRHLVECFNNRLTSGNLRLSERYVNGELKVLVVFSVSAGRNVNDYVARFQYERFLIPEQQGSHCGYPPLVQQSGGGYQETMFVDSVEFVDMPERIVTSNVTLTSLNKFARTCGHSLYCSVSDGGCVFLDAFANREISSSTGHSSASLHKLPSEMIQRASEIVNDISDDEGNTTGNRMNLLDAKRGMPNLRLFLGNKSIGVRVAELADSSLKVRDVLFGPFDFKPDALDSVSH